VIATALNRAPTRTVGRLVLMSAATAGAPSGPPATGSDAAVDAALDHPRPSIDVTTEGDAVVIAVAHKLDEVVGAALIDAATAAVGRGPRRIDVDLRALEAFTDLGARALVGCRDLGSRLPEGLHYRTGRGPGREALLAAYTDADAAYTT
jgi:hypothetical protein